MGYLMVKYKQKLFFVIVLVALIASCIVTIKPARASADSWETKESMPTARDALGVAVVDGKIYAIGGMITGGEAVDNNEVYDPLTDTWEKKSSVPSIVESFGIAVYNNLIHVIGGGWGFFVDPHGSFHAVYNPETDTWKAKTAMPTPRDLMDANVVDGKIYVISGATNNYGDKTNVTEVYDTATDTWTTKTPIPTPVAGYASAVVDKKIYVIGGILPSTPPKGTTTNLTQIYDMESDTWSYGAPIPTNISSAAAGATTGGFAPKRIHVLGTDKHYVYDPEADTWTTATAMPTPRSGLAVAVINDTLYTIGGSNGVCFTANEQYTPSGYIPEFPSWIILPLFLTATLVVAIYRKKLSKTSNPSFILGD